MFFKKKQSKRYIEVTKEEFRIIMDVLIRRRNQLIEEGQFTDGIDELILAIAN